MQLDERSEAEYVAKWKDASPSLGAGRNDWERATLAYDRRHRKPEKLAAAPGGTGILGRPPPGSSYRCVSICRSGKHAGEQCPHWALRGQRRCRHHGGRGGATRGVAARMFRLKRYPAVYSKYLSDKLLSKMAEASGQKDALDLSEELKLVRVAALDAVQLYDVTQQLPSDDKSAQEMRLAAGLVMREALEAVGDMAKRAADIEKSRDDRVGVGQLHVIVAQIVDMAYEAFGDEHVALVRKFAEQIKTIRLPSDEVKGTMITPDQDVLAMDETVPRE